MPSSGSSFSSPSASRRRSQRSDLLMGMALEKVWKKFGQSMVCSFSFLHSSIRYFWPVMLYSHSAISMFSAPRATAQSFSGWSARFLYSYLKKRSISTSTRLSLLAVK